MNSRFAILFLVAVVLGELMLLLYSSRHNTELEEQRRNKRRSRLGEAMPAWEAAVGKGAKTKNGPPIEETLEDSQAESGAPQQKQDPIRTVLSGLSNGMAQTEALARLEKRLLAETPAVSLRAIQEFLQAGLDAPTGKPFRVGYGRLDSAPTLRVFLLDLLGRIAQGAGKRDAADVGRQLLATLDSPDESAVNLRNVAWAEASATGYLGERLRAVLSKTPWREEPSGGFLAVLDVAAFLASPEWITELEGLAGAENTALRQSVAEAEEHLSERAPAEVMRHLNRQPQQMAARPMSRAGLFAKLDLSVSPQKEAAETYLLRRDVSGDEKARFLELLTEPLPEWGTTLLTRVPDRVSEEVRSRRVASAFREWREAAPFAQLRGNFDRLLRRWEPPESAPETGNRQK
jgi:hypothetical protein